MRLVFSTSPNTGPIWPNIGFDFEPPKRHLLEKLAAACPDIEVLPAEAQNVEQAKKLLAEDQDKQIDGYLVYLMACWTGVPMAIASAGKPTIFADMLYGGSGEFLIANAAARRAKMQVACVASSRLDDIAAAAQCFKILKRPGGTAEAFLAAVNQTRKERTRPPGDLTCPPDPVKPVSTTECLDRLRHSTILLVGGGWGATPEAIEAVFGTKVLRLEFKDLNLFYQQADPEQARQWADRWTQEAEKVLEPDRQTIQQSAAMYLGMRALMAKHQAQAISINCLGGFYGGHIQAYPCLGFHQMNNDGLVGACEGDLVSTITMLAMAHLVGRPGFISDPVIDTSKNQIIYAHCVAPSKVFGPKGPSNPYHIRNHSEDRKGAAIRSLMPLGYMTTTIEFHPGRKEVIFHQGKSVENVDEDKACRTKLAVEPNGDIEKLLNHWDQWGWHRVTFYGDLKGPVRQLADALKMRFVEEA
ncbi:MAG: hypothetical protein ACUVUC_11070 [Thermoguttaceae bacterium]